MSHNKKALIEALEETLGIVSSACKIVGISRRTFYRYVEDDQEFAKQVEETKEVAIDFAEDALFKQIKNGVPSSTIFFLKTRGKHRGYKEADDKADNVHLVKIENYKPLAGGSNDSNKL